MRVRRMRCAREQRCSVYDDRTVVMSRRSNRAVPPSMEPQNNAIQQNLMAGHESRAQSALVIRSYHVCFVDLNDAFDRFSEPENSMERMRLEPTAACGKLLIEAAGPVPQESRAREHQHGAYPTESHRGSRAARAGT